MGGVGAEAGPRCEQESALGAVFEKAVEASLVEMIGDVEEEKSAPFGRLESEVRGDPRADLQIALPRLGNPGVSAFPEGSPSRFLAAVGAL